VFVSDSRTLKAEIPYELAGRRLDQALAQMFPDFSRSRLSQWVREGKVQVDGHLLKPKDTVLGGEMVELLPEVEPSEQYTAEDIPLDILYEDQALIVLNKPAGLVVHPAVGNRSGTLQNALLHHDPALASVPRAGIVHRLDKDTSGLMVVARSLEAHTHLVGQLQERSVRREYLALVQGEVIAGGTVEAPIGRHPVDRKRMAVVASGKPAVSHYRVEERFKGYTLLRVSLETGRTHQIRVHMAHIHFPIVGDPVYGGRLRVPAGLSEAEREAILSFRRQALHAAQLGLIHPSNGEPMSWQAPPPADMQELLEVIRTWSE
jgi:23S rRNA pseudouridine1911/1915/1917 synthase